MTAKPEDLVTRSWMQQIGTAVRLAEVITEESRKIREYQLVAALEAHRSAAAALERLEKAPDPNELWRIQGEWLSANLEKSLAYWRRLYEGSAQTQLGVMKCLCEPLNLTAPQTPAGSNIALFGMMGDAYKRWLDTTTRFYAAPGAAAEARKGA